MAKLLHFMNEATDEEYIVIAAALALCIAYKHQGANQQASTYFMKMIK